MSDCMTIVAHIKEFFEIQLTDGTRCRIASPSRHPTDTANKKDKRKAFFFVPVILMKMAPRTEAKLRKTTQSVPNP